VYEPDATLENVVEVPVNPVCVDSEPCTLTTVYDVAVATAVHDTVIVVPDTDAEGADGVAGTGRRDRDLLPWL